MPRVHGQAKQKNKPFKGKAGSKKNTSKIASTKTKHISKTASAKRTKQHKNELVKQRKMRKIKEVQKLARENEYLDQQTKSVITQKLKEEQQIKVVLLLPCNADADCAGLIQSLYNSVDKETILLKNSQTNQMNAMKSFFSFEMFPISNKTYLKSKIQFISPSRDVNQLIDLAKCADIICPILSCKSTNTQGMNLDPYIEGKAFDETGYTILNMLRSIGVPSTVGIIQHVESHQQKHHDKIIRLFRRFLTSELGEEEKIVSVSSPNDLNKLIRTIDSINMKRQAWKNQRGYMMVENVKMAENGSLVLEGFLKGNCVNANQLIHITGIDDFQIESIEIKKNEGKVARHKKSAIEAENQPLFVQYATNPQNAYPFAKNIQNHVGQSQNQLLSALEGLKFQAQQKKEQKLDQEENDDDFEDEEDQMDSFDEEQIFGNKEDERTKRIEMQMRKQDELEFEDQVQYTVDDVLREKFQNYQGLKNFKTSEWNHLQNLPQQYEKIFTFKHYSKTYSNAINENISKAFAYPGFFVSVTVKNLAQKQQQIEKIVAKGPLVASFLLKHERKMTMLHARVKRNPYYPLNDSIVQSNQTYLVSMGFRKFYIKPIFSRIISGTQKTKYVKKIQQDYQNHFLCSFYYYNYFPPAPFAIYRVNHLNVEQVEPSPVMYGELVKCDPLHIILERIIICGYPYKINRRRCTVRYMFFNPKDVKFFKPIQVKTKMGLRGRIEESLGMHGLMKVFFNEQIKQNDTVCMFLYKRAYPEANF